MYQALAMTKRLFVESVIRLGCAVASGESRSSSCPALNVTGASLFLQRRGRQTAVVRGRQATPCVGFNPR